MGVSVEKMEVGNQNLRKMKEQEYQGDENI